jgi:hypothetical protein
MFGAEPARPPKPSLIERCEPPRAVLPRWFHMLLGAKPETTSPKPEPCASPDEARARNDVPPGPTYRCYPR